MTSRLSIATRIIGPILPLVTFAASYLTLLALGFPQSIAATLPFVHWMIVALVIELMLGATLVFGDIFLPSWRKRIIIFSISLLTPAAFLGWIAAYSLVSYP